MRVIAGTARRLPLKSLPGNETRPTTDRIKETLFNMLQDGIPGSCFLDLFAGSGQIGLEALSRGASYAVFVEKNKKACACIKENISVTHFEHASSLLAMETLPALRVLERDGIYPHGHGQAGSLSAKHAFDYIFMDPPYRCACERDVLSYLAGSCLVEDTTIIIEASVDTDFSYVENLGFQITKEKRYKTNKHIFIAKEV